MPKLATADAVDAATLIEFLRPRHRAIVVTRRKDGSPQMSPVTYGVDAEGRIVIATYPQRAKTRNLRRDPRASYQVVAPELTAWAVGDGFAELTPPAADPRDDTVEALVDLYRSLAGEHPDWAEYRAAMVADRRVVLTLAFEHVYGARQG